MNATNRITQKLEEVFAPMDAEVLIASQRWAKERTQAICDYLNCNENKKLRRIDTHKFHDGLYAIAGGKTWYNALYGSSDEQINTYVTRNCEAITKKRNTRIASKLNNAGVTTIISEEFTSTSNGFNGVFMVNSDKGQKKVTISTVYSGGHNVQCLHLRVLVNIKGYTE